MLRGIRFSVQEYEGIGEATGSGQRCWRYCGKKVIGLAVSGEARPIGLFGLEDRMGDERADRAGIDGVRPNRKGASRVRGHQHAAARVAGSAIVMRCARLPAIAVSGGCSCVVLVVMMAEMLDISGFVRAVLADDRPAHLQRKEREQEQQYGMANRVSAHDASRKVSCAADSVNSRGEGRPHAPR